MGVDLAQLQGSGPQGRVMKADVLAHAEYRSNAPPPSRAAAPRVEALQADEVRPLRDALAQLQMAYAQQAQAPAPSGGEQPPSGGEQPPSGEQAPTGEGDQSGEAPAGPAQRSGRLWVPGQ